MDAKEIREAMPTFRVEAYFLREIAAQLAELNATLKEEVDPNVFVDTKDPFKNLASATPAQDEWKCNCENPTKFADICSYCRGKLL